MMAGKTGSTGSELSEMVDRLVDPEFFRKMGANFLCKGDALDLGLEDCSVLEWDRSSLDFFSALASFFLSFISADIRASAQHGKSRIV